MAIQAPNNTKELFQNRANFKTLEITFRKAEIASLAFCILSILGLFLASSMNSSLSLNAHFFLTHPLYAGSCSFFAVNLLAGFICGGVSNISSFLISKKKKALIPEICFNIFLSDSSKLSELAALQPNKEEELHFFRLIANRAFQNSSSHSQLASLIAELKPEQINSFLLMLPTSLAIEIIEHLNTKEEFSSIINTCSILLKQEMEFITSRFNNCREKKSFQRFYEHLAFFLRESSQISGSIRHQSIQVKNQLKLQCNERKNAILLVLKSINSNNEKFNQALTDLEKLWNKAEALKAEEN